MRSGSVMPRTFNAASAAVRSPAPALRPTPPVPGSVPQEHGARTSLWRVIALLRQRIGVSRFQIVGTQLRIIGAGDKQHRLAALHLLAGNDQQSGYRSADLCDHRCGVEPVVGHRTGQRRVRVNVTG